MEKPQVGPTMDGNKVIQKLFTQGYFQPNMRINDPYHLRMVRCTIWSIISTSNVFVPENVFFGGQSVLFLFCFFW